MLTIFGRANLERFYRNRWLREIMTDVFSAESEAKRQRKALFFVEVWRDQQAVRIP
jgi:hypothetical protein